MSKLARTYRTIFLAGRPKSFPGLILAGLLLVAIPLVLPLVYSAVSINQLSKHGRQAVYQAEQIVRCSKILAGQAAAMERSVKLSLILGDATLLNAYHQSHDKFREALRELAAVQLSGEQAAILKAMDSYEARIFEKIGKAAASRTFSRTMRVTFVPLLDASQAFLSEADGAIKRQVDAMQARADRANTMTAWLLIALLPFAVLLALGFSAAIARPIREIDETIRAIGNGELSKPVRIDGPQDLQQLGERLNWMRMSLLEIEKQKATFLQHVSHELKTPLTSIREGADLLAEGVAGRLNAKQKEVAGILFANSVQLQKRIEDLLNFSALQAGKAVLTRQRLELRKLLDAILQDQQLALENRSLKVDMRCPDISLEGDEQKLKIVVDNLLSNAIKYSPVGGLIRIIAGRSEALIRLDVIDAGLGVHPDDRDMVFDAFYQGRTAPHGHTRGTGLGLSIARDYALAHGGNLELVDVPKGTCFRLTLPVSPSAVVE